MSALPPNPDQDTGDENGSMQCLCGRVLRAKRSDIDAAIILGILCSCSDAPSGSRQLSSMHYTCRAYQRVFTITGTVTL